MSSSLVQSRLSMSSWLLIFSRNKFNELKLLFQKAIYIGYVSKLLFLQGTKESRKNKIKQNYLCPSCFIS